MATPNPNQILNNSRNESKMWGVTARMVNYYCSAGRIKDAIKKGDLWLVPASAEKPVDGRYKVNQKFGDGEDE